MRERRLKLERYRKSADPYPAEVKRTASVKEAVSAFSKLAKSNKILWLAGRLGAVRAQGGIIFADLKDQNGQIQLIIKKGETDNFDILKETLDIGDFTEVKGTLLKRRGERNPFSRNKPELSPRACGRCLKTGMASKIPKPAYESDISIRFLIPK